MENTNTKEQKKHKVSYLLFLYRKELAINDKSRAERMAKIKCILTHYLISNTLENVMDCSVEDLEAILVQMEFKTKLLGQIQRISKLKSLGIKNAHPDMPSTDL